MKAAQLVQYGDVDSIRVQDIPSPNVTDDSVLIEVHAAGVNPFDYKLQLGYMKEMIPLQLPITLGGDIAGVVTAIGANVTSLKIGDAVFGQANAVAGSSGSFAEYANAKANSLALKPKNLDFIQAAAAPLAGVSAIQALYDHMNLQTNQKILIHGGAGGIGSIAIQIAKHIGAYVATTVSENDIEYVKKLGANEIIDYKKQSFEELLSEYDAVYDTVGGETTTRSMTILKQNGILVSMVNPPDDTQAKMLNITALMQSTRVTTDRLEKLLELIEQNIVTISVEKTFPLAETATALEYLRKTPPKGKIVLQIK